MPDSVMDQIMQQKQAMEHPEAVVASAVKIKKSYSYKRSAADAEINGLEAKGIVAQVHVLDTKPQTAIVVIIGQDPLAENPDTSEPWIANNAFAYTRKTISDAQAAGKPL